MILHYLLTFFFINCKYRFSMKLFIIYDEDIHSPLYTHRARARAYTWKHIHIHTHTHAYLDCKLPKEGEKEVCFVHIHAYTDTLNKPQTNGMKSRKEVCSEERIICRILWFASKGENKSDEKKKLEEFVSVRGTDCCLYFNYVNNKVARTLTFFLFIFCWADCSAFVAEKCNSILLSQEILRST